MRFFAKLFLLFSITLGFQWFLENHIDEVEDTVFVARVFAYRWSGNGDEQYLIDASDRIRDRKAERFVKRTSVASVEFDNHRADFVQNPNDVGI